MREKTIYVVSLIAIIIGLSFLALYAEELNVGLVKAVDDIPVAEEVRIQGVVQKLSAHDKVIFLTVQGKQPVQTEVIVFHDEDILIQQGDYVEIVGEIEDYKGKKEVIASKVVLK